MKYKVYKSDNDIIVECTKCETKHHFNFYTFGRYFLDNTPHVKVGPAIEDDLFQVDGGIMSPKWVCRKWNCTNEATVKIIDKQQYNDISDDDGLELV